MIVLRRIIVLSAARLRTPIIRERACHVRIHHSRLHLPELQPSTIKAAIAGSVHLRCLDPCVGNPSVCMLFNGPMTGDSLLHFLYETLGVGFAGRMR